MNKILACIDPRGNTDAVIDWAAWAALRLAAPLEFLHVLERHPERAESADLSGAIGLGAQESLLQQLSDDDAQRSQRQREAGRQLLAHARRRAGAAGVAQLDARLRHGDFVETAIELQAEAGLFVLGEHHLPAGSSRRRADHHLEQVIRGLARSVLVATTERFEAPARVVLAFDGSPRARRALAVIARHPLLHGLPVLVAMVGADTPGARLQLAEAQSQLAADDLQVTTTLLAGEPQLALPALVKAQAPALLVMGAFGHSRLRQWLRGSVTTSLLRLSNVPALILR